MGSGISESAPLKYNAIFEKKGKMVYISHLDLMKLFRRAIRRAGFPFVLSEGFTPRVKISIPKALKLGRTSNEEEMAFWLMKDIDNKEILESFNMELPEGIKILEVRRDSL